MKLVCSLVVGILFMGQVWAQEAVPNLTLKPTKMQVFGGVGQTIVDGDTVSESQFTGIASLHFFGHGYLLRPYLSLGEINPEKVGVDNFGTGQVGIMLGKKVTKDLILLAGGSVVGLFPEKGDDEYRPTINIAANLTVYRSEQGLVQILAPVAYNWTKDGNGSANLSIGAAWVF